MSPRKVFARYAPLSSTNKSASSTSDALVKVDDSEPRIDDVNDDAMQADNSCRINRSRQSFSSDVVSPSKTFFVESASPSPCAVSTSWIMPAFSAALDVDKVGTQRSTSRCNDCSGDRAASSAPDVNSSALQAAIACASSPFPSPTTSVAGSAGLGNRPVSRALARKSSGVAFDAKEVLRSTVSGRGSFTCRLGTMSTPSPSFASPPRIAGSL